MNMFANLRIGTRLGLGFGVLLALILAVAGLSQYAQQSVGEVTDQITQRDFIKTEILYGIMLTNQEAVAQTNKMLQLTDVGEVKRIVDGWSSAPTNDKYKQLTELTKSPAGKAMLADLIEVRKVYSPIRAKTIGLLVEGKREEAAKFWNNEGLPALAAYRTQLQKMLKYQKEQVESGTKKIADSNRSSSVLIFSASPAPFSICVSEASTSTRISFAAAALRCARLRTSPATTAKPRPFSPARAASTAAFSARIFVWNAIPSITEMMSTIFFELALIDAIVSTTWLTTAPPLTATCEAPAASWFACFAFSAFCFTVLVNSSIDEAVSSRLEACSSVRWLRSAFPVAICCDADEIVSAFVRTPPMRFTRFAFIFCSAPST